MPRFRYRRPSAIRRPSLSNMGERENRQLGVGTQMSKDRFLAIYLNDHLAGSIMGSELAKRAAASNKGTSMGEFLAQLARDIEQDRKALEALMTELGIRKDRLKDAAAWMAEKAGRLKLNGKIVGYSDLSRLVELEGLTLGVEGKLSMWRNLIQVRDKYPPLAIANLEELVRRAETQRADLERARQEAAKGAL
jgi:hypothetical protein